MDKHFREQAWYQNLPAPQKAMQSLLSQIEKENISRIRIAERR
ncbi:MAG: YARHG domain-containing protein [Deltaproteobacteria bacterium]|nr:YARHG domain-containing protein [Deltaproteobacteria bacterium]